MEAGESALPSASVVIIVKDEPSIAVTLERLKVQCAESNAECIVVDASETRLLNLASDFPWVRWIQFQQPAGRRFTIPHQRNEGVRAARSTRIAFCDAGFEPADDWLRQLLDALDRDPRACWCGRVVSLDDPPLKTLNDHPDGSPAPLACTANMGVATSLFERVGGFDEDLDHGEDIDFGWRLQDAGFAVVCAHDALMHVRWGDFERQLRRAFRYGRCTPGLLTRNPSHALAYCRECPDVVLYPAWLVGLIGATAACAWVWWLPLAWTAGLAVPAIKNRSERPLPRFLLLKLWRAVGFLTALPPAVANRGTRSDPLIVASMRTTRTSKQALRT